MKEVMALIRLNMVTKTKKALADAGISSVTARECLGRGKGMVDLNALKGAERGYEEAISQLGESARMIPKRMLTIIVSDRLVEKTVETIIRTNQTGKAGDGKIFVLPVSESWRIRTGEYGDKVLDDI